MNDQYRLAELGNSEIVAGLSELVRQSNALTAHLVELEERKLHLELGFASLFAYCTEGLGMSEGAAGQGVAAARVCRRFPEVFERVARGELHLCALCALAPHLKVSMCALVRVLASWSRSLPSALACISQPTPSYAT